MAEAQPDQPDRPVDQPVPGCISLLDRDIHRQGVRDQAERFWEVSSLNPEEVRERGEAQEYRLEFLLRPA